MDVVELVDNSGARCRSQVNRDCPPFKDAHWLTGPVHVAVVLKNAP
jgi:hypothetical protein